MAKTTAEVGAAKVGTAEEAKIESAVKSAAKKETEKNADKTVEKSTEKAADKTPKKAAKKETAKKTAKKETAKKTASKKAAAKDTKADKPEGKKRGRKPAVKRELFIQYNENQLDENVLLERVQADCESQGVAVKELKLYLKPQDNACYYVANGNVAGKVDLF